PNTQNGGDLFGISALSSSKAWSAGQWFGTRSSTLAERWNGTKWSQVSTPDGADQANQLDAIAMASGSNGWAVGWDVGGSGFQQTLTELWTGTKWKIVPSPDPGTQDNVLQGVTVIPGTDHYW